MKNLIGISGKMSSGKDTVGKIIKILTNYPDMTTERVLQHLDKDFANSKFEIKRFADKLKDCVCLIIGCTREQLEDQEFKNTPLGPEWDIRPEHYHHYITEERAGGHGMPDTMPMHNYVFADRKFTSISSLSDEMKEDMSYQMTPRLLLQLLGTDCGRRIIHPNIWVNASFAEYTAPYVNGMTDEPVGYPNWIFTDMRFPNELDAIKERDGLTIRVNRFDGLTAGQIGIKEHESETALDKAEFDYTIQNDSSMEDLIHTVKLILQREKII